MALYQPTNAIPSSYTKGTIDVNDAMEISWQVNGNSAMTAFQIDFYLNDYASTPVTSTGRRTDDIPTDGFYGTDRFGRPQFFTWSPNGQTWEEWSRFQLANGNEYKYKITQFFVGDKDEYNVTTTFELVSPDIIGKVCYFKISNNLYVRFNLPIGTYSTGTQFFYNTRTKLGFVIKNGQKVAIQMMELNYEPTESEKIGTATNELKLQQTDFNVFKSRKKPLLTIFRSNEQYLEKNDFPTNSEISTSIGYFHADYEQEQGDMIRWIKWQVATANNGVVGEILADTGDIYTPTLNYEFNGFFNNCQYAIRAIGESESGQETELQNTDNKGWIFFNINIENQGEYTGDLTVQCLSKENATLLEWEAVEVISPTISPSDYIPKVSNGEVVLDQNTSVSWNNKVDKEGNATPLNFTPEWAVAYKADIPPFSKKLGIIKELDGRVPSVYVFSPNAKWLIVGYNDNSNDLGTAILYSVNESSLTFHEQLKNNNGTPISHPITVATFSNSGNTLAINGNGTGNAAFYVYTFTDDGISNGNAISKTTIKNIDIKTIAFSPNESYIIVGGSEGTQGFAQKFEKSGTSYTEGLKIEIGSSTIPSERIYWGSEVTAMALSDDGKMLVIGNDTTPYAKSFAVTENNITFISNLNSGKGLYGRVNSVVYTIQGYRDDIYMFVLGGDFRNETVLSTSNLVCFWLTLDNSIFNRVDYFTGYNDYIKGVVNRIQAIKQPTQTSVSKMLFVGISPTTTSVLDKGYIYAFEAYGADRAQITSYNGIFGVGVDTTVSITDSALYPALLLSNSPTATNGETEEYLVDINGKGYNNLQTLLEVNCDDYKIEIDYVPVGGYIKAIIKDNNGNVIVESSNAELYDDIDSFIIVITNEGIDLIRVTDNGETGSAGMSFPNGEMPAQSKINSITILGLNSLGYGTIVKSISAYKSRYINGVGSRIPLSIIYSENPNFEPVWSSPDYNLYMTANFNGNLEAGTGTATGSGFRVYRQEVGKNVLTPIATVPSTTTSVKDYGIVSRKAYKYSLYAYDNNGAFMNSVENEKVVATCFKTYSLLVCDYDETNDEYHVRKQYLFALNLSNSSVGNNNTPTLNANFTRYPTRMPSTQNYASGTLQGLIGAIYTVPALIEQIGNYKWTTKPSTMDYFDNVDLEKELYDLSTAPYQLFLRDMKGRLRMIHTNAPISMTTNIKQKQQSISISFPWVEIGDASDVKIIQTPNDYGWNNDNQILDVNLNVDVATGELSATYPFPYNGTKFYLTGINKEMLTAKTPIGVTPAQFELSNVAENTNDGVLTAKTVSIATEILTL